MDVAQNSLVSSPRLLCRGFMSLLLKPTVALAALFLLSAVASPAQTKKEDPVIYPRNSAATDAPASAGKPESNSSMYLAVALLAGAGGWWLWLKRKGGLRGSLAGNARLTIAETKSL